MCVHIMNVIKDYGRVSMMLQPSRLMFLFFLNLISVPYAHSSFVIEPSSSIVPSPAPDTSAPGDIAMLPVDDDDDREPNDFDDVDANSASDYATSYAHGHFDACNNCKYNNTYEPGTRFNGYRDGYSNVVRNTDFSRGYDQGHYDGGKGLDYGVDGSSEYDDGYAAGYAYGVAIKNPN